MILAIYLLAVILLVAGFAGLISAINLVPTDLGFTYFQAGATSISAGIVVLAIGLAAKALDRSLRRLATPEAIRLPAADPVMDLPPLPVTAPEMPASSGHPGTGIVIAGAAVAAGAMAATTLGSAASTTGEAGPELVADEPLPDPLAFAEAPAIAADMPAERSAEELERDLFAQMDALPQPPLAVSREVEPVADVEPVAEVEPAPAIAPDLFALPPLEPIPEPSFAGPDNAQALASDAMASIPPVVLDVAQADLPPPPEEKAVEELAPADRPSPAAAAEPVAEAPEPAPAVAAPMPGLILDADFAAVADEMLPALAPISSLEVVGAYDSGGTRFTMYSDGSVVAAGQEGERRFRSLDELRRHIDGGQA